MSAGANDAAAAVGTKRYAAAVVQGGVRWLTALALTAAFRRSRVVTAIAAGGAVALIATAITTGLRVPGESAVPPFPPESALDYGTSFRSPFAPLRADFIREELGGANELSGTATPGLAAALEQRPTPAAAVAEPRPPDVHAFTNDDMQDARVISQLPYTAKTDTTGAGREAGEPSGCSSVGGTAWYRYRAARDETLTANTFGTDYPVTLGVFRLAGGRAPAVVTCDSDVGGNALAQFDVARGATYVFQLTSQARGGDLVFTLEPPGVTTLISSTPSGEPGPVGSDNPSISGDGGLVAFSSYSKLTADAPDEPCRTRGGMPPATLDEAWGTDYGFCSQIYVHDRRTRKMRLVSVSSSGEPGNLGAGSPWISGNGRFVAFAASANNLVPHDTNGLVDIFVHDLEKRHTARVSVSSDGRQSRPTAAQYASEMRENAWSPQTVGSPSISDDGRYVAFTSHASDLVHGDTNEAPDIFVHDRASRRTERVSIATGGAQASGDSRSSSISPNGRYVFLVSDASDLAANDGDDLDVFLHDRVARTTELISVSSTGGPANGPSSAGYELRPYISASGRFVVFESYASNLVRGDTNGAQDVFVRDRVRRTTKRVSVSSSGKQADGASWDPTISRDGRYVAFTSVAEGLSDGARRTRDPAGGGPEDLFVHDLQTHTTVRVPVSPRGHTTRSTEEGIRYPTLSADGSAIAFLIPCVDCPVVWEPMRVWVHERPRSTR